MVHGLESVTPQMLADLSVGIKRDSNPADFVAVGDFTYFTAEDGSGYRALWASDGTAAGTRVVEPHSAGGPVAPVDLTAAGGSLYFLAAGESGQYNLWRSDGTAAGTHVVKPYASPPWADAGKNVS